MNEKPALDTLMTMHVEQDVSLSAPPERVFQALTDHVAGWWGAPYLLSEEATDLILEPKLGGSFYEVWGIDEGVLYATVTAIQHGRRLELTGPIGMDGAYQGIVVFELEPTGSGTSLHLTHRAFGELTPDTQANYASGWADLLGTRLKAYVERGERHGLK